MKAVCFVENITEPGQELIGSMTTGKHYDAVFIQVSIEKYITKDFQDWLKTCVLTRINPTCDAVRIAITTDKFN